LSPDKPATENIPFSFQDKQKLMEQDKDKRMSIIVSYWKLKGIIFDNKESYEAGLKRELRASGDLKGFSLERINEVGEWLKKNADFKWTLETYLKYINEDLNQLTRQKSKEPEVIIPDYAKRRQYEK
jgi:hypothetical protein